MPGTTLELHTDRDAIRLTPVRNSQRTIVEVDGLPVLSPVAGARVTDAAVARSRRADQR